MVRLKKSRANNNLNDNLFSSLIKCNSHKFWRLWNSNFNKNSSYNNLNFPVGKCNSDIANFLANSHTANCSPSNLKLDSDLKSEYYINKDIYDSSFPGSFSLLTSEDVCNAIHKISSNCTPGFDNLSVQHFLLAHPSAILILKSIFNICLLIGSVPITFGKGIVTPIPKFKGNKTNVGSDDFRGITINVISSKIFEHCLSLCLFLLYLPPHVNLASKKGLAVFTLLTKLKTPSISLIREAVL
jgi:hypothetical protein